MSNEIRRIMLLAGLFIVGYLLIQAWNEDYNQPSLPPPTDSADIPPSPSPAADIGFTDPGTGGQTEVPSLPQASLPGNPAPGTARRATLVRIETDTLLLWVDRHGGDIVEARLRKFPVTLKHPEVPITLLQQSAGFVYTAQSGLLGAQGTDSSDGRSLYDSIADTWVMASDADTLEVPLVFAAENGNLYTKTFAFVRGSHTIEVAYEIYNGSGRNLNTHFYAQLKRSGSEPPLQTSSGFGPSPYVGAALTTPDARYEKLDFEGLDSGPYKLEMQGGWVAMLQHYFLSAWIAGEEGVNQYSGRKFGNNIYLVGFVGPLLDIAPGETGRYAAQLYLGPKYQSVLSELAPNLDLTVDYGFLWWLAQPLFIMLEFIEDWVGNWGVAIIILTIIIKILLYPLSEAAYRSMANMRRVAPQLKRLQERHAGDRQKLSQEMMSLYRKERINPLGGCFPMLLQMPVFIALYWVLYESVELRQAPFIFWIDDLAALDDFFILPILMGISMYLQQHLNPPIPDPMQARIMKMLPIIFTVFFAFFPSGLVLYWLVNNVLSIGQQWLANRRIQGWAKA